VQLCKGKQRSPCHYEKDPSPGQVSDGAARNGVSCFVRVQGCKHSPLVRQRKRGERDLLDAFHTVR
jgi:hypothetical protein